MRKVSIALVLIALTGLSVAVVGGPNASEGEMVIMDSGSSSATQATGPNGTKWKTTLSNLNSSCISGNQSQNVEFSDFTEEENMTEIEFSGVLKTPNPCHKVTLDVEKISEKTYAVEFVEKSTGGVCVECQGVVKFKGSFAAPGEYKAFFRNEGNDLAIKETPGYGEETKKGSSTQSSIFSNLFSWLGSLF